ncbi:MAG: ABC transporter ATP-binding protein [Planctomycetota bacterium]|jgi:ABC-type multidrug transport system ATPase subunit
MGTAVSTLSLTKRFARTVALDDVSMDVPEGSLFGLLGPNGAGKTTLFSVAAGFLKATSGTVEVLGVDVRNISRLRGRFSMLPQDAAFQAGIPVIEQLVMFSRLNGLDPAAARKASQDALEIVGLGEVGRRAARTLSHGMAKRVALCQAFIGEPEVIFLDEPTSGLDPENARRMRDLIRQMRGQQTVVLSSHNLQEVQDLCDHVAILHLGELVQAGSMAELTTSSQLVRIVLGKPLMPEAEQALRALPQVYDIEKTGEGEFNLKLNLSSIEDLDPAKTAILQTFLSLGLTPKSISEGASLEARFLEITGGTYDGGSST